MQRHHHVEYAGTITDMGHLEGIVAVLQQVFIKITLVTACLRRAQNKGP